jgi:hypothetical protein
MSKEEMSTLRSERDRIKAQLYSEYGDRINAMMAEEKAATSRVTPAERREMRLHELLSERTPLRQEVKNQQAAALQRLVEEAKRDSDKGVDVGSRLSMLLSMQEEANRPRSQHSITTSDAGSPGASPTVTRSEPAVEEAAAPAQETPAVKASPAPETEAAPTAAEAQQTEAAAPVAPTDEVAPASPAAE